MVITGYKKKSGAQHSSTALPGLCPWRDSGTGGTGGTGSSGASSTGPAGRFQIN